MNRSHPINSEAALDGSSRDENKNMDCDPLEKELLEGRIIEKLKVEDLKKTIKNVKIARSPRLRDG